LESSLEAAETDYSLYSNGRWRSKVNADGD
jgi:hypothetical protein